MQVACQSEEISFSKMPAVTKLLVADEPGFTLKDWLATLSGTKMLPRSF
jgi:hypothetical protein